MPFLPDLSKHTVTPEVAAHERKQMKWFLIACLILLIGTASGDFLLSLRGENTIPAKHNPLINTTPTPINSFLPKPTPFTATVPITNWRIYTNNNYGFTINYPPFLPAHTGTSGDNTIIYFSSDNPNKGQIFIGNVLTKQSNISFQQWLDLFLSKQPKTTGVIKTLISPKPYMIIKVIGLPTGSVGGLTYFVNTNNTILIIGAGPFTSDKEQQKIDGIPIKNIVETMISTLTFIQKTPTSIPTSMTVCTQEAKLCPDGKTYVSRTGPNCAFAACP